MGRFAGRSVVITGAARGQGRAHALAFAREGANVAICDIGADIATAPIPMGTMDELAETARLCEAEGARVVTAQVDVRDGAAVQAWVDQAIDAFGAVDVAVANAGIFSQSPLDEMSLETFNDTIDVNLRGVFHTARAVLPHMKQRQYGRIVAIASTSAVLGYQNVGHYTAAKHAVTGLIKTLAKEVGADGITANCVLPTGVGTTMIRNEAVYRLMNPDDPSEERAKELWSSMNAIPAPWVEPEDVARMVLFLADEESRHITGARMTVDLGMTA
jgi:SDR family mycofactocin-dependent oxidoreductase